jgi:ribosomal protein L7/L12
MDRTVGVSGELLIELLYSLREQTESQHDALVLDLALEVIDDSEDSLRRVADSLYGETLKAESLLRERNSLLKEVGVLRERLQTLSKLPEDSQKKKIDALTNLVVHQLGTPTQLLGTNKATEVRELLEAGEPIEAMKIVRKVGGLGLKQAKEYVEGILLP